jgi:hypothetical protein
MMYNETPKMYSEQNQIGQPEAFAKMMSHREDMARNAYNHGAIAGAEQIKQGGIAMELRHMEKNLAALTAAVDALANKLSPMIRAVPEKDGEDTNDRGASSELAELIRRNNRQLQINLNRIYGLTGGIDL